MPDISIPGARQSWAGVYGWAYDGGPNKAVLHSTETDSYPGCVDVLAHYLDGWANPHVVWDPWTGDLAMCGRADWAGGALVSGNKDGKVVLQVEAVGRAGVAGARPFFDSPMRGWPVILDWFDSWGIPRQFPAGMPLPYPQSYGSGSPRDPAKWNRPGYFAHSQVPGNDHGDPGLVDTTRLWPAPPLNLGDEVSVCPNITASDHSHPKALAHWKQLMVDINPAANVANDAATAHTTEEFRGFFAVKGDAPLRIGVNMWRTALYLVVTEPHR